MAACVTVGDPRDPPRGGTARLGDRGGIRSRRTGRAVGEIRIGAELSSGRAARETAPSSVGARLFFESRGLSAGPEPSTRRLTRHARRVRRTRAAAVTPREGQVLLVLEAMKMEHAIRALAGDPPEARREGDLVDAGVELAEIGERPAGG